ncbi:hypothetical protein ABIC83_003010 [Roseateles asaccharophilus]|uniref:hypothetical protein n=1 Tax=Roseateles asaccharophilus TaxID=582607 RepID=UPI003833A5C5
MSSTPCQPANLHISNVRIVADSAISLQELHQVIAGSRRIRIGWDPDADEDDLPGVLPCWLLTQEGSYVRVGEVIAGDDASMRQRLADYQLFMQNGGMGRQVFPVTTFRGRPVLTLEGRPVFIVELLRLEPHWIGGEPDYMVQAGKRRGSFGAESGPDALPRPTDVVSHSQRIMGLLRMNPDIQPSSNIRD